ncbi:hypothetical protein [uncultured Thiohalocapsa sp.]|uniref:hypothetical protein n=1 Tax=uncultured Thiohalocapsa sp. TaxID=768990 RepID=UPI0025E3B8DD|nr:hypothetical protein [uncultured Thiohalocapsa sp.]
MSSKTRRAFLSDSGKVVAGAIALGSVSAHALTTEHEHGGAGDGHAIDASAENTCATCQFWGGMRKISDDKSEVVAQSMGWCNNPDSPNHMKLTAPDHQKTGIWNKWAAL